MDHQPYEDWLLNGEPLDRRQQAALHKHLLACRLCAALASVNAELRSVKAARPAPGFVERFRQRLEARRRAERRRRWWGVLVLAVSSTGAITLAGWPYISALLRDPNRLIGATARWLASLAILLKTVTNTGAVILDLLPDPFPAAFLMLAAVVFCGSALLWVQAMRKFTHFSQGV